MLPWWLACPTFMLQVVGFVYLLCTYEFSSAGVLYKRPGSGCTVYWKIHLKDLWGSIAIVGTRVWYPGQKFLCSATWLR